MQNLFAGSIVRPFARPLLVLALLIGWLSGCATSEGLAQKSKGYYQEGVASLEHDQQKALWFQRLKLRSEQQRSTIRASAYSDAAG
jgi:hypothetical protein